MKNHEQKSNLVIENLIHQNTDFKIKVLKLENENNELKKIVKSYENAITHIQRIAKVITIESNVEKDVNIYELSTGLNKALNF